MPMGTHPIYKYHFRPAYYSDEFLIEIYNGAENEGFLGDFLHALAPIAVNLNDMVGLWMNEEVLMDFSSELGPFQLTKDSWGFAFVMARENQKAISKIHKLLSADPKFKNIPVNNADYKK